MGSLMAGWNSRLQDPKKVKLMRNKSLTRGEIDAYWKAKKKTEEDHLKSISPSASLPATPRSCPDADAEDHRQDYQVEKRKVVYFRRSTSMPMERTSSSELHVALDRLNQKDAEDFQAPLLFQKTTTTSCWWTASNWAFLNEPPILKSEAAEKPRPCNLVHTH